MVGDLWVCACVTSSRGTAPDVCVGPGGALRCFGFALGLVVVVQRCCPVSTAGMPCFETENQVVASLASLIRVRGWSIVWGWRGCCANLLLFLVWRRVIIHPSTIHPSIRVSHLGWLGLVQQ